MRIKSLELRAKCIVEGFQAGLNRSPYHGFSVEFTEYRQYTPGDDPRYLDWRLFARSDRYYIKRFEDETNLRCHILLDLSRSMDFGSLSYTKADYARTLAATLAYFLVVQRDAVGLCTFGEAVQEFIPARYRPGHLRRLLIALERPAAGSTTDLVAPLERTAQQISKRGMLVLISDLFASTESLNRQLGYLRARGHEVLLFHVLDPAERGFTFDAPALFRDVESGRELYVDPTQVARQYRRKLQAHLASVRAACDHWGASLETFATDTPLDAALGLFLKARMQTASKQPVRTGRAEAGMVERRAA
jgi:uncharacterized protein (DUF58 family)